MFIQNILYVGCCGLQGLLDEQFNQLQQLQDESNPNFLEEVVSLFFEDSQRILENMTETMYVFSNLIFVSLLFMCVKAIKG
jgi:hypothetical protein